MIFPAQPINTGVAGFLAAVFSGRMAKNFFPPAKRCWDRLKQRAGRGRIEKIETPEGDGNSCETFSSIFGVSIEKIETPEGDGNNFLAPFQCLPN